MPDHPIPVRFVFVLMHPADNFLKEATGIGRVMGALFSDEVIIIFKIKLIIQSFNLLDFSKSCIQCYKIYYNCRCC